MKYPCRTVSIFVSQNLLTLGCNHQLYEILTLPVIKLNPLILQPYQSSRILSLPLLS